MTLSRIAFKFIRLVVKRISSRGMKKVNSYDLYRYNFCSASVKDSHDSKNDEM